MKLSPSAFCLLTEAHSILENRTHKGRVIVMLTMKTNCSGIGHRAFLRARHHTGSLTVGPCQGTKAGALARLSHRGRSPGSEGSSYLSKDHSKYRVEPELLIGNKVCH